MGAEAWSVIGTGVALLGAGAVAYRSLHGDLVEVRRDVGELRERMARLEGLFEGFTRRESSGSAQ